MKYEVFRDRISGYIDEYLEIIRGSNRVLNYDTLNQHIYKLRANWLRDEKIILRQITETFNEVCFIHHLVCTEDCQIEYEPITGKSGKSIDLKVLFANKTRYFDIKTIHPNDLNKWDEFLKAREEGRIDGGIYLFEDGMGGLFWHHMTASRSKFSDYSLELESKIQELGDEGSSYFMVFCGNDIDWHEDELEDFVEFYKTGYYVSWDHFATMSKHDYKAKKIEFNRTIHNFTILEREEISKEYKVIPYVRMQEQFRTYLK